MQGWQTTYLGMRELPREISTFELQAFFTFSPAERELIEARRGNRLKLGLALHIGFLRMSGRLLDAFRVIPLVLWRHLGTELGIDAPDSHRCARCMAAAVPCSTINRLPASPLANHHSYRCWLCVPSLIALKTSGPRIRWTGNRRLTGIWNTSVRRLSTTIGMRA
jgi:hypothetical protein